MDLGEYIPVSILYKSIAGRYRPVRVADVPITARYRFIKNASWDVVENHVFGMAWFTKYEPRRERLFGPPVESIFQCACPAP